MAAQGCFVAHDRDFGWAFDVLDVQDAAVVDQPAVTLVGLGGGAASDGLVVAHGGRQADADARLGASRRFGGRVDARPDVLADGARAGHPGDGAVGSLAGEAEHTGREGGDHHRAGGAIEHVQFGVDVEELAGELHPSLFHQGAQDGEILAGVQRGPVV